ncbi:endonuclease VII domain-containing protein [Sanguibacter inulinus]|uniref:Endonuclease VII domain-containing protein n=1 Tax=Sanguibacter inulinus TaxID=60922 RepID=A0A853EPL7_9MICO|nr:endonuclease VII domain-containing protein [Sanguibacter inulinus]NYS92529.1 endonuclease VII domain-containing protein [Sanguibacter inulinus]
MPRLTAAQRALEPPVPAGLKRCSKCRSDKVPVEFDRAADQPDGRGRQCKTCRVTTKAASQTANPVDPAIRRVYVARYRARHPERVRESERRSSLRRYGLTPELYDQMLEEQQGACAICRKPETVVDPATATTKPLAVDHCHETGQTRALLCQRCNVAIGLLAHDPKTIRSAATYVEEWACKSTSITS